MASIIADLSDDIKKMKSLKEEIQQVKKELGSINVKVELDIKRDMEARLKALTGQYDALVQKVAQAEAKIAESTSRINKSAETIIKAQEQMTKAASGQGVANAQGTSGGNTAATNAQTASVQAQAKAYDELANEIDAVMGTRAQNIKRMVEEQNAIRIINEELKRMQKLNQSGVYSASETRRIEQLNASLMQHKTALSELRQSLNNSFKLDSAAATSMNALSQSLARMRMTYRELTEEERNSPFGQELLASIQQADAKIKQLDASIGNHQRNVGNYASGWNGLNMSIQQIGRELPSLAMGWNTFFLAISNNLPILTDEIKRAKDEYNALKAAGQQATPVWKQVVSSLLSWQTALTVGITLLTMYGSEIIDWVGNLFKAQKQLDLGKESVKAFNDAMLKGGKSAQQEVTTLNLLYDATQNVSKGMNERLAAVEKLQQQYPSYFANFSKEDILAGKAADSYVRLAQSITASAKAQAARNSIVEQQSKVLENEQKINEAYSRLQEAENKLQEIREFYKKQQEEGFGSATSKLNTENAIIQAETNVKSIEKEIAGYRSAIYQANKISKDLEKNINIEDLIFDSGGTEESKAKAVDNLKDYLDELTKLREDNEDRQVELMEDGTEKQIAEIKLRYKRMRDEVRSLEQELTKSQGGKLTKDQEATFSMAYTTIDMREWEDISKTGNTEDRIRKEKEAMNRYLQEYGTFQQKRLAITEEYQQKIAEAGGSDTWQGRLLQKRMEEALKELDFSQFKDSINLADIFGNLDAQTTGALKSLRDKLKEYINNAAKDLRPEDLKELQDAFNDLDFKIAERDPFGEFGKSWDDYKSAQDAVTKAQQDLNTVMQGGTIVTGIYTDETGKLVVETLSQAQAEERLNDSQKKRAETLADLTTAMNSIGSKGMAIVNAGNEIVGMLDNFGIEIPEVVSSTLSGLGQVMSGLESIDITKPFSLITGAVSVISGIGSTIAGWFSGDKKNEKRIQRLQDQIDTLTSSYDKLGRAVEDAYSKDASNLIEQQNKLLEQQKVLIQNQIKEEQDKKKTDNDRIKEWQQQIEEINQTLEDNKEKAVDAIFGEDLQSAIENFADAYAEAWANGEDKAESAKEAVKKMMRQMVTESIKAAMQSSGAMEEIRNKLQQFYADNVLTGWEQDYIYNMAEELQKELDEQFGWADSLFGSDKAKEQQSATSKGFETMTQDQASELNGRFTALNESSLRQEAIQQGIRDIADDMRNIIAQSYLELQQISENTGAIIIPIKKMQKDMEIVKQNTSRL